MFEWKHPKHHAKIRKDFREEIEKEKQKEIPQEDWVKGYNKWKKTK